VGGALEIAREYEYASVYEIDSDILAAWAETSGFSTDELAMIQPGYGFLKPKPEEGGPPDTETVRRVLGSKLAPVNRCVHDRIGARKPHPRRVDAKVTVHPSGRITSIQLTTDLDKEDLGVQGCIVKTIEAIQFDAFSGKEVTVGHRYAIRAPTHPDGSLNLSYLPIVFRRGDAGVRACVAKHGDVESPLEIVVEARPKEKGTFEDVRVRVVTGPASSAFASCVARVVEKLELPVFKGEAKDTRHVYSLATFGL